MKDDDFKLSRGFVTDRRTNERTFVNVESLSRLKIGQGFPIGKLVFSKKNHFI